MNLFIFGLGYSALHFARTHREKYGDIFGTAREPGKCEAISALGIPAFVFSPNACDPSIYAALDRCEAIISSIPPDALGDPVMRVFESVLLEMRPLQRVIYLSTVGVYGDHKGGWVDEAAELKAVNERSKRRVDAENAWMSFARKHGCELHILRLAGIYGPGRNAIENLRAGKARRIVKKDQVFNRIHVEDIGRAIQACLTLPISGGVHIWNIADNEPSPPQDVVSLAAELTGLLAPPEIDFDTADLTPMARSFYGENKRISNRAMREGLGIRLAYPSYREGLQALIKSST